MISAPMSLTVTEAKCGPYSTLGAEEKCIQGFGWKAGRKENSWKTYAQSGGLY